MTFRTKLLLSVCVLVLLTGVTLIAVADISSQASTRTLVDSLFREVSSHAATQTKDFVLRRAPLPNHSNNSPIRDWRETTSTDWPPSFWHFSREMPA